MMISPEKLFLFSPTLSIDAASRTKKTKIFDSTIKLFSISKHTQLSSDRLRERSHCRRRRETHKEKPPVEAPYSQNKRDPRTGNTKLKPQQQNEKEVKRMDLLPWSSHAPKLGLGGSERESV
jgi:hypothetical protein